MDKKSFILYADYSAHIKLLSNEQAGALLKNIFAYVETGETCEQMDAVTNMAFSFITANIDRDLDKWADIVEKRREAGRIGGNAKAANRKANIANANFDKQTLANVSKRKQNVANVADNVNVNVNDNVNDNDIHNARGASISKSKKNQFCNYPQAETDIAALEKKVFIN